MPRKYRATLKNILNKLSINFFSVTDYNPNTLFMPKVNL